MRTSSPAAVSDPLLQTLAEFRYELRRFHHFSEAAAREADLEPQQHQLLLQVAGAPAGSNGNTPAVTGLLRTRNMTEAGGLANSLSTMPAAGLS